MNRKGACGLRNAIAGQPNRCHLKAGETKPGPVSAGRRLLPLCVRASPACTCTCGPEHTILTNVQGILVHAHSSAWLDTISEQWWSGWNSQRSSEAIKTSTTSMTKMTSFDRLECVNIVAAARGIILHLHPHEHTWRFWTVAFGTDVSRFLSSLLA